MKPKTKAFIRENAESILWAIAIALVIRTFIVAPFKIPSGSMRPTLIEGDRILVSKFIYHFKEPQRGDVIVFKFPSDTKRPFIKRLIGKPNDKLYISEGKVYIDGGILDSSEIINSIEYKNQGVFGQPDRVVEVPDKSMYVLGDNSDSSHDSRFWGFVPRKLLIGKAFFIFWPPSRWRILK